MALRLFAIHSIRYRDASGIDHALSPLAAASGLFASAFVIHVIGAVGRRVWLLAQPLLAGLPQLLAYRPAIPNRRPFGRRSALSVLQLVTQHTGSAVSEIGVDVGGTLAKFVFADSHSPVLPDRFGVVGKDGAPGGRTHHELRLRICRRGLRHVGDGGTLRPEEACTLQFLSGQSSHFEQLLASTTSLVSPDTRCSTSRWSWIRPTQAASAASSAAATPRQHRRSTSAELGAQSDAGAEPSSAGTGANTSSASAELGATAAAQGEVRRVAATGGGAHKLREWSRQGHVSRALRRHTMLPDFEFNIVCRPSLEPCGRGDRSDDGL